MNNTMFLGIGRGGCKIIDRLRQVTEFSCIRNARYVFVDCDSHDLHRYTGHRKILLDRSSSEFPSDVFVDVEQLIIVAGMSGFAGSEISVPVSAAALSSGIKSVFVVGILGFMCEGKGRVLRSLACLNKMRNVPGISLEIYNMGRIADKYGDVDVFSAIEKADEEIINIIEGLIQIKEVGYDWNGYSIIGDKRELDNLINEIDNKGIDEYDVLHTLSLEGNNCVASGEGDDFGMALEQAVGNLLLTKTEKLLLRFCCGCRLPSISEMAAITPILSKAGVSDKAQVKLDIVQNRKLGNSFKVLIVASRECTEQVSSGSVSPKAYPGGRKNNLVKQIFSLRKNKYE